VSEELRWVESFTLTFHVPALETFTMSSVEAGLKRGQAMEKIQSRV